MAINPKSLFAVDAGLVLLKLNVFLQKSTEGIIFAIDNKEVTNFVYYFNNLPIHHYWFAYSFEERILFSS